MFVQGEKVEILKRKEPGISLLDGWLFDEFQAVLRREVPRVIPRIQEEVDPVEAWNMGAGSWTSVGKSRVMNMKHKETRTDFLGQMEEYTYHSNNHFVALSMDRNEVTFVEKSSPW